KSRDIALPTSKWLHAPVPGRIGSLNSFPATIALSPDHRYAAFLNDGYGTQGTRARQSITILDLKSNALADFPDDRLGEDARQSYFLGLAFSGDGRHLYASMSSITDPGGDDKGDTGNGIAVYGFRDGQVSPDRFIKMPPQKIAEGKKVAYELRKTAAGTAMPYPAGLAVVPGKSPDEILVANNLSDNAVLLNAADGSILKSFDLSTNRLIPSAYPDSVVISQDGRRAWCSLWNASQVAELDLDRGAVTRWITLLKPDDPIAPGSHPSALLLSPDEKILYVALSNADRVAAVAADSGKLVALLDTTAPGQKFAGTYPSALALSADAKRLFVTEASLNAVGVFDISEIGHGAASEVPRPALGFVPTDWYPTTLAFTGGDLLIGAAKGEGTGPDSGQDQIQTGRNHREHPYIATLLYGSVARIPIASIARRLPEFTREVEKANRLRSDPGKILFRGGANPIRHVIYILKENRTYDQIFGDLGVGNGDASLTMYGADVTPNLHKLALQFGVLDNFYDSGEVSGDGHNWSTAAITSDYNEQTWQIAYRGRERTYDYQGMVAGEIPLENQMPDVNSPSTGFIWDNLSRHHLTYRDYGEFVATVWCKPEAAASPQQGTPSNLSTACAQAQVRKGDPLPANLGQPHGSASPWPWPVPLMHATRAAQAALQDHIDPQYPDFNTDYPDQLRADEFLNQFDGFVAARKQGSGTALPQFILLYLPDDHTGGTRAGKPRPAASVADNDLAVGRVVDAVSHSPYWDDTAVFVIEDDAQNGADHVDAHRSIALVISKYSPGSAAKPRIEHGFYTTVNMMHTIESLLGLPPMNQNDAYAPVMAPLFTGEGQQAPYAADYRNRDSGFLYQVNPPRGQGSKQSEAMDFTHPDAVNTAVLNAILWRDRKGKAPMPAPRHNVLPAGKEKDDDGD
ncbi:MAG TPA: hypothetical protein VHV26_18305, partial [Rhizomicrobium sp.]|nr:hypothetical protein [Rhizomicrobium sp.]